MDTLDRFNDTMRYIETRLTEEIDYGKMSAGRDATNTIFAVCSPFWPGCLRTILPFTARS